MLGLRVGNFGVYVYDERGRHRVPHAHIKQGARRVGSIFLLTLELYDCRHQPPRTLLDAIATEQDTLINLWLELNGDD